MIDKYAIQLLMSLIAYNRIAIYGYDLNFHSQNYATIMDEIFKKNFEFHVKERTKGKVQFQFS